MAQVFPLAGGTPVLKDVGHIATLFARKTIRVAYDAGITPNISNTDYEGEIKDFGDTVDIPTLPEPNIRDYSDDQDMIIDKYTPGHVQLLIDQGHYFTLHLPKVSEKQSHIDMRGKWPVHFGKRLAEYADEKVIAYGTENVHAANIGADGGYQSGGIDLGSAGSPLVVTRANVDELFAKAELICDEQGIGDERFMAFPNWLKMYLRLSDVADAAKMGDKRSILRGGKIGELAGFSLHPTRLMPTQMDSGNRTWKIFFGDRSGMTYAAQLLDTEHKPHPTKRGDYMSTVMVYGRKVVRPEAVGVLYVRQG